MDVRLRVCKLNLIVVQWWATIIIISLHVRITAQLCKWKMCCLQSNTDRLLDRAEEDQSHKHKNAGKLKIWLTQAMNTYVLEDEPSRRGSHTLGHRFKEASRGCAWRWGRGAVTIDNGRFNHLSGSEVNSSIAYMCIHTNTRGGRLIRPAAHSSERAELVERDVNINSQTIKLPGLTRVWRDAVPLTATWRFPSLLYL